MLYDITVDTNIQFERSESTTPTMQMEFNGRKSGRTRSWPSVSRSSSAQTPSGNSFKSINANTPSQCLQLRESTSISNTKCQIPNPITCIKSSQNSKTSPKQSATKESHPFSSRNAICYRVCWECSERSRTTSSWTSWRRCFRLSRSSSTQATSSCSMS